MSVPTSPVGGPYWEAAAEERLVVQRCTGCGEHVFPPRIACPFCFSELEWIEAEGRGTVYSYGIAHRIYPPDAVPEDELPAVGAVIELAEGPLLVSNLVDCDPADVEIGAAVEVTFGEGRGGRTLPYFELA